MFSFLAGKRKVKVACVVGVADEVKNTNLKVKYLFLYGYSFLTKAYVIGRYRCGAVI